MELRNALSNFTRTDEAEWARFPLWQGLACLGLQGEVFGSFFWKLGLQMMDFVSKPKLCFSAAIYKGRNLNKRPEFSGNV